MDSRIKIAPDMLPGIYELAGQGKSLAEICEWLKATHSVSVTPNSVRKKLTKQRAERSEVTKAVVREKLAKTVTSDIDVLDRERTRLGNLTAKLYKRAIRNPREYTNLYCGVVDHLRKLVDTKLHYSGADAPDDPLAAIADAERRVTSRLDRLAASRDESAATSGGRSKP